MTVALVHILKTFFKCSSARSTSETKAKPLARGCGVKLSYTNHTALDSNLWASTTFICLTTATTQTTLPCSGIFLSQGSNEWCSDSSSLKHPRQLEVKIRRETRSGFVNLSTSDQTQALVLSLAQALTCGGQHSLRCYCWVFFSSPSVVSTYL